MLENLKMDILLLNIFMSLHVGLLNPIHACISQISISTVFVHRSISLSRSSIAMASSTQQAVFVNKEWTVGGGHIQNPVHYQACDTEEFVDPEGVRHVFIKLCKSHNNTQRLIFGASSASCGMSMSHTTIIEQISRDRDFHRGQLIEKLKNEAAREELQKHQDAMQGKVDASVDDAASTIADSMIAANAKRGEKRKVNTRLSLPKYITFKAPPMYTRETAQIRANVDDPRRFLATDKLFDGVEISCKVSQDPERQSYPSLWLEATPSVIDYLHRFAVEEAQRGVHVVHPRSSGSGRDSSGSILKGLSRLRSGPYKGCFRYKSPQFRDNKSSMIVTKDIDKAVEIVREMLNGGTLPAWFPPKTDSDLEVSDSANESDGSLMTDGSIAYLSDHSQMQVQDPANSTPVDASMIESKAASDQSEMQPERAGSASTPVDASMIGSNPSQMLVEPGRPDPTSPSSSSPNASESSGYYKTYEAYTTADPDKGGDGRRWPLGRK